MSNQMSSFKNCSYLKHDFLYHNLILFLEKNFKTQARIFYENQNHLSALSTYT